MYFRRILNYFCVCLYAPAAAAPASIHPRSAWLLADAAPPLHQWVEQLEKRSLSSNLRSRRLFFFAWREAEKSENSQSCLFWLTLNPLISPYPARRWANRCVHFFVRFPLFALVCTRGRARCQISQKCLLSAVCSNCSHGDLHTYWSLKGHFEEKEVRLFAAELAIALG